MILPVLKICGNIPASVQLLYNLASSGEISLADFLIRIVGISCSRYNHKIKTLTYLKNDNSSDKHICDVVTL